jgi:hypothetical protein
MPGMEKRLNRQDESTIIDRIVRRSAVRIVARRHKSLGTPYSSQEPADCTFSEKESRL